MVPKSLGRHVEIIIHGQSNDAARQAHHHKGNIKGPMVTWMPPKSMILVPMADWLAYGDAFSDTPELLARSSIASSIA
jgi:hypothetical protein